MENVAIKVEYSKAVKELRKKVYVVRPIKRKGGWVSPEHDSSFMNDGSKIGLVVPVLQGNVLKDPFVFAEKDRFTLDDIKILAEELGLPDASSLNIHAVKGYWRKKTVFIDRNGLHLRLSETAHLISFLVLKSNIEIIAPNWTSRFDKGTYKFALVEEGEELVDKVSNLEDKKNAYIHLSKIDKSSDKMTDFLYVYYLTKKDAKRPPTNASIDWLKNELGRIIEEDLKIFNDILGDKDYILKLLIQKSVKVGALLRNKHLYFVPGADKAIGTIEDLIEYLDNDKNQDLRIKLMHQIEEK